LFDLVGRHVSGVLNPAQKAWFINHPKCVSDLLAKAIKEKGQEDESQRRLAASKKKPPGKRRLAPKNKPKRKAKP
jgi:hypothetical protein